MQLDDHINALAGYDDDYVRLFQQTQAPGTVHIIFLDAT